VEFENGFDIDGRQKKDNEEYENKGKIRRNKKARKGIGKLKPIPLSQLIDQWKPKDWIVDLFGAKGSCVLLAADKGSGKTTFIYRMAEALGCQKIFMGELKTKKSKVFVWQADESKNNALDKFKLMGLQKNNIDFLFNDDEGGSELDIDKLRDLIKAESFDVVVLDSVTGLIMGNGISIKDSEFCIPLYKLNNLASELQILIVITAHLRKEDRTEVNMNDILGAGTQPGAVSDVWSMWTDEKDDEIFYLKCLGKRNCERGTKWKLQGNKEDYSFELIEADCGDLLPTKKNELSDKFLKFLTKETNEYTYKELAAEFKCNFEHARRICIKLFTEGKIERTKIVDKVGRPYFKYWKK
tara:strand:+ start:912 stop:1976 length:1065 start_codon:yes stop_codon:yes gene_type:complete